MHPTLARLGWDDRFAAARVGLGGAGAVGRVQLAQRRHLRVLCADGPVDARVPRNWPMVAVGDWVVLGDAREAGDPLVDHLLPRRTWLERQAAGTRTGAQVVAANLDVVLLVTSANQDFNPRRLERYLVMVHCGGCEPVLVLNKTDLDPEGLAAYRAAVHAVAPQLAVAATSAKTGAGCAALAQWLGPGRTVGLIGSSGVGKSTLANRLLGTELLDTGDIRAGDDKGRHTTTRRELVVLPDDRGVLLDTPGMRELQLWDDAGLSPTFPEVAARLGDCRWRDCDHAPGGDGCALWAAVDAGDIPEDRLKSWRKLRLELDEIARRRVQAAAPRKSGKARRRR